MGFRIKLLAAMIGFLFFVFALRSIRSQSFRPSYSVLWLGISFFLISIPLFEPFYKWIAVSVIGIEDARHIIYVALIGFLMVYVFYLTSVISRLSDQVQNLLIHTAIIETKSAANQSRTGDPQA